MAKKRDERKLPDFDKMTYAEEAHWWDTHSFADYLDEFEEVEVKFEPGALTAPKKLRELSRRLVAEHVNSAINIRLTKRDHINLRIAARRKGVGISTLARMWILENLRPSGMRHINKA